MLEILEKLLKLDKAMARVVFGGLALLAAAAIAMTWSEIDLNFAMLVGMYILFGGVFLAIVAYVVTDQTMKWVLGWALVLSFLTYLASFLFSSLLPVAAAKVGIPPSPCLVKPWVKCDLVQDIIAVQKYTPISSRRVATIASDPANFTVPEHKVFVQFAGVVRRGDVKLMMTRLKTEGWNVQGAERGGERTAKAIGYNVVRYGEKKDEEAAKVLAARVTAVNLTGQPVSVRLVSGKPHGIRPGEIEVWISRP